MTDPHYTWAVSNLFSLVPDDENLLENGSMEASFYWQSPNHFVAQGWHRWWVGDSIPEYDDVRPWRPWCYDGEHAQVYFRWGATYTAGIFQKVSAQPCRLYQFSIYGRNHSNTAAAHHARVGIDPWGRDLEIGMDSLPSGITWSPEKTYMYEWGRHVITAEAHSDTITVITYASPDPGYPTYDTFWDAATLVRVPFPDERLPEPGSWEPSDFIRNLSAKVILYELTITWDTAEPALAQVWYNIADGEEGEHPYTTALNTTLRSHHSITISNLETGDVVSFVTLARHLSNDRCVTEVSASQVVSAPKATDRVPPPSSWAPSKIITDLQAKPALDMLLISWNTPGFPSTTQVWYDIIRPSPPISSTPGMSHTLYLPLIITSYLGDHVYEFATPLDLRPTTHHQAVIEGLSDGDTVILVALSGRVEDGQAVVEPSNVVQVKMSVPSTITRTYLPAVYR